AGRGPCDRVAPGRAGSSASSPLSQDACHRCDAVHERPIWRWWEDSAIVDLAPRGCSSMVEPQSSKLMVRIRFPSSPPIALGRDIVDRRVAAQGLSVWPPLLDRWSGTQSEKWIWAVPDKRYVPSVRFSNVPAPSWYAFAVCGKTPKSLPDW